MDTQQIYAKYMIPLNLQQHMLRVASLAKVILENWKGIAVNKDDIIQACLFHDIAKPMKFDLAKQAQFGMSASEIAKLDQLQRHLIANYGEDEHHATVEIFKEIGCTASAVNIVDNLEWSYIPKLLEKNDLVSLIPIYGDMRIGPKGILTLKQRLDDLKARTGESEHEENGVRLESIIRENVTIDLDSINDAQINANFDALEKLIIPN